MPGYLCTTWTDVTTIVKRLAEEPVDYGRGCPGRIVGGVKLGGELPKG